MLTLYNLILPILIAVARLGAWFNPKLARGLAGRRTDIRDAHDRYANIEIKGPRILVHVASYGELEQAKPIIRELKKSYPGVYVHLTFFSPSGYDNVKGKYADADVISYLPLDLRHDVSSFIEAVKPDLVLFTRYDVWPNFAAELDRQKIPAVLFAATASGQSRRMMPFAKGLHKAVYSSLTKILAITENDRQGFLAMGVEPSRVEVGGDTRFDQVAARKALVENAEHALPDGLRQTIEERGTLVFVVGSAWPEDEKIIRKTLQQSIERSDNILTILVPHEPTEDHVRKLLADYPGKSVRLSEISDYGGEPVIVVDSIGKLFWLYRYADIAMIGGGLSAGVHNVLEAAVWGVPTIVGPNHKKSQEVQTMIDRLATFEVSTAAEFEFAFWQLVQSEELRRTTGEKGRAFVEENQGATGRIMEAVFSLLKA